MLKQDRRSWLLAISALIIVLDRWSKIWVAHHIADGDAITVIPRYFYISHVLNPGAAFSLFSDSATPGRTRWLLTSFSILAAVIVLGLIFKIGRRFSATTIALALILGGAIGNVWDRIHYGVVTDFLEVFLRWGQWSYHWPDFNIADSAIVCGGILIMLDALLPKKSTS
ncbi:signal peptidase II [Alloacidobacterium dinghuense]|uniref:Lipoprotein signal peptidase n=1 Tax=Alloacidobacterium dinghuense TaxID=2763107 RepID=A0A7G8BQU5_9BACT|nr:signal peptidase II [Alloacidobacterium dinghuense]